MSQNSGKQLNNWPLLAGLALLLYDYLLTLPTEIHIVWPRPKPWFILIRYLALSTNFTMVVLTFGAFGSQMNIAIRVAGAWEAGLFRDLLIFAFTLLRGILHWRHENYHSQFVNCFVLDGFVYFCLIAAVDVANILIYYFGDPFLAGSFAWLASASTSLSLSAVLTAHLILNMREVADTDGMAVGDVASEDANTVEWNDIDGTPMEHTRGHNDTFIFDALISSTRRDENRAPTYVSHPHARYTHNNVPLKPFVQRSFGELTKTSNNGRTNIDMSLMQQIFARDLEQNKKDSGTPLAVTASFYHFVNKSTCKKEGCTGRAVLKTLRNGPSNDGKYKFVGCSKWRLDEEYDHQYVAIPSGVDEKLLAKYIAGTSVPSEATDEYDTESCAHFIHPRHGLQENCPHMHFSEGKLVVGKMVPHPCPVQKIVYASQDPDVKVVVVIFRGLHSHPPWPMEKPGQEAKADLDKCLNAIGTSAVASRGCISVLGFNALPLGIHLALLIATYPCFKRPKPTARRSGSAALSLSTHLALLIATSLF
ncbi:hypothetical protein B0H13DRAFT_2300915 [Mycena leptocephala]|nr:hypothetical protein B0H13DRAFT_2300915 [Mycena leptocephala]